MLIRSGIRMVHFDAPGRAIHVRTPLDDAGFEGILLASYTMESAECVRLALHVSDGFQLALVFKNGIVLELGPTETEASGRRIARRLAGLIGCVVDIPSGFAGPLNAHTLAISAEPVFASLIKESQRASADGSHEVADHVVRADPEDTPDQSRHAALFALLARASARLPVATREMADP